MIRFFTLAVLSVALTSLGGEVADRKMTWAHHVPWNTPLNTGICAVGYYNFPILQSSGNAAKDWKSEIKQAQSMGINGFFPDVVAHAKGGKTAFVSMIGDMLKAAEGTDFQIAPCLDVKTTVAQQVRDLKEMLDLYAAHPNYPHWRGRPVVDTYTYTSWTPEELAAIRSQLKAAGYDIFLIGNMGIDYNKVNLDKFRQYLPQTDMIYSFGFNELDGTTMATKGKLYEQLAVEANIPRMGTVYPGYYGAWLNGRNDFYQVHDGFDNMHRSFEAAVSPHTKWLHFTTWNDHDETSLMPMAFTPANALLVNAYAKKFRGENTVTGTSEILFAYHREELPGTLLRFEAMTLPTVSTGTAELSGRLLKPDGQEVASLANKKLKADRFDRVEWLVPSSVLASCPALTPEFTILAPGFQKTVRLPEMYLVSGWQQNAVTVKVAAGQIAEVKSSLDITRNGNFINAEVTFDSAAPLQHVTLWRNDRPLAVLSPEVSGKTLLNLLIKGKPRFTITVKDGELHHVVQKFGNNLSWRKNSFSCGPNQDWAPIALALAGTPDLELTIDVDGADPLTIKAAELARREKIDYGGLAIESIPLDATWQNRQALNVRDGHCQFTMFSRDSHFNDRFQLRFDTMDGKTAWSAPLYPFAGNKSAPISAQLVQTATNLETPSGATGCKGHNEYLTADVPFRKPALVNAKLSPLSIRGGAWDFAHSGGLDRLGDMPVEIPPALLGKDGLIFTGKDGLSMRLRTYPIGAMTLDLKLKPAAARNNRQGLVTRLGWSEAVELFLLPNGRLEVCRSGNDSIKKESFTSKQSIPDNAWSRVRVTCDNAVIRIYIDNKLDSSFPITIGRSYGNCKWILGQGYTGELAEVKVLGAAFAPGDIDEPQPVPAEKFLPLKSAAFPGADEKTAVKSQWRFPATLEKRGGNITAAEFPSERLKNPLLLPSNTLILGPGANIVRDITSSSELKEGLLISVPLLRFDRAQPCRNWYAVLLSIVNDKNQSVNFNIGSNSALMISANEPQWTIKTGNIPMRLPVVLKIAKYRGQIIFMLDDKIVYKTKDDNFTRLQLSTSSPTPEDATILQVGDPVVFKLNNA